MKNTISPLACIFFCLMMVVSCTSNSSSPSLAGYPGNLLEAIISDNLIVEEGFMRNVDIRVFRPRLVCRFKECAGSVCPDLYFTLQTSPDKVLTSLST